MVRAIWKNCTRRLVICIYFWKLMRGTYVLMTAQTFIARDSWIVLNTHKVGNNVLIFLLYSSFSFLFFSFLLSPFSFLFSPFLFHSPSFFFHSPSFSLISSSFFLLPSFFFISSSSFFSPPFIFILAQGFQSTAQSTSDVLRWYPTCSKRVHSI